MIKKIIFILLFYTILLHQKEVLCKYVPQTYTYIELSFNNKKRTLRFLEALEKNDVEDIRKALE